ncbi:FecR family protein [Marinoscillum sp.]|uniref:FecR family protein n=1 Tax=Marinoscillum sp. TaxID=2024838 RepID=UPI003BAA94CF
MKTELILKFFTGRCTPKEAHELLVWINTPEGEKEFKEHFEAFRADEYLSEGREVNSDKMLSSIHDRIKEQDLVKELVAEEETPQVRLTPSVTSAFSFSRIAAAITLLMAFSFVGYLLLKDEVKIGNEVIATQMLTKRTEPGQKLSIHLSDGSVAVLNSSSSITYPKEFAGDIRQIEMEGEVYFDVARNKDKPFVVSTSRLSTTALGTSFNINARNDHYQQVSLLTGRVKVEMVKGGGTDYLEPGEEINFVNDHMAKAKFRIETKTLWREGIIFFDNQPLAECFKTLELWYGVTLKIDGKDLSEGKMVSGRFDNDNLRNVLNSIGYAHNFDYKVSEERVHITFSR